MIKERNDNLYVMFTFKECLFQMRRNNFIFHLSNLPTDCSHIFLIVVFTPYFPVFLSPSRYNFRDNKLKLCIFYNYHTANKFNTIPQISHQNPSLKNKNFLYLTFFIKFMDLLNMTNRAQIHEFYKKVKQRKFLSSKTWF